MSWRTGLQGPSFAEIAQELTESFAVCKLPDTAGFGLALGRLGSG